MADALICDQCGKAEKGIARQSWFVIRHWRQDGAGLHAQVCSQPCLLTFVTKTVARNQSYRTPLNEQVDWDKIGRQCAEDYNRGFSEAASACHP